MAVSPDILLNIKAPTAAAKPANASPKTAPQPSRDEPSAFANVYAKERQSKPIERQDSVAKPVSDKPASNKPSQETAEADGTDQPAAAEAGNELPAEHEMADSDSYVADAELDPLLLFGMGGQGESSDGQLAAQPPTGSEFLVGITHMQAQATLEAPEGKGETAVAGQHTLNIQSSAQKNPFAAFVMREQMPADANDSLATSLLAGEQLTEEADERSLEDGFGELLDTLGEPKESRTSATDAAINRLNPLTQAIAQHNQVQQAQRPAVVPGQPVQMHQSGWSEAVVDRVMWLSSQNLKSAEIQLDPAELGRMEVRIDMNKDQTQVTFLSPHAGVRDALEGQMQRLRDMFAQQGMSMDVNVSDQSRGWQGEGGSDSRSGGVVGKAAVGDEEISQGAMDISTARTGGERGLVDYYA